MFKICFITTPQPADLRMSMFYLWTTFWSSRPQILKSWEGSVHWGCQSFSPKACRCKTAFFSWASRAKRNSSQKMKRKCFLEAVRSHGSSSAVPTAPSHTDSGPKHLLHEINKSPRWEASAPGKLTRMWLTAKQMSVWTEITREPIPERTQHLPFNHQEDNHNKRPPPLPFIPTLDVVFFPFWETMDENILSFVFDVASFPLVFFFFCVWF